MTKIKELSILLFLGVLCFHNVAQTDGFAVMSVDLGSEWMKIAIVKPGVPMEIALNKQSKRKTEVAVSMRNDERVFGNPARGKGVRFPATTYFFIQDLLGKKIDSPLVKQFQKRFPFYNIKSDEKTGQIYFVHDAEKDLNYTPEELMAMMLNNSRTIAEEYAETTVDTCVITVPSFYNQAERKAVLYAAELAGLKVSQLMDTNAAAALNYGVYRRGDVTNEPFYLMLYDMGASSTEASVIAYQQAKVNGISDAQLSVKGVGFDRSLGGLEMELRLRDLFVKKFNAVKKTKSDVTKNARSMAKLLKEANRVKKVLSANTDHMAQIEDLIDEENFRVKVTREELEEICEDLWPRVMKPVNDALQAADITMDKISQIILIGGGTRVPKVQQVLLKESGKSELGRNLNADEAAALGASYQAAASSSGFKVKNFHVKQAAIYPIEINFQRDNVQDDGSVTRKNVKRTLFQRSNPYPQRKVITFNRFTDNFKFSVDYGDVKYLSEDNASILGSKNIADVELDGVKAAHEKHGNKENTEAKGVKAHFRMDESGILNLESIESVFEGNKTENVTVKAEEEDDSTFQKLKDSLSNLFGSSEDEKKVDADDATQNSKEDEEKSNDEVKKEDGEKSEKKEDDKKDEEKSEDKKEESSEKVKIETKVVKVKHSEPISSISTSLDRISPSEDATKLSKSKLKQLADVDAFKLAREVAMNKLETYIYEKKDRLYSEGYEEAMTDEERETITTQLNDASEWLDFLEGEPAAEVYDKKRKELKEVCKPWLLRVKQRKEVEPLLKDMESMFNYTVHFLEAMMGLKEEDQIYTPVEIKTLADKLNTTVSWKNSTLKEEKELKPFQDPILKPNDLKIKMDELNREVKYLLNKAKTAKPKAKKTKEEEKVKTAEEEKEDEKKDEKEKKEDKETTTEKPTQQEEKEEDSIPPPPTEKTTTEEKTTTTKEEDKKEEL